MNWEFVRGVLLGAVLVALFLVVIMQPTEVSTQTEQSSVVEVKEPKDTDPDSVPHNQNSDVTTAELNSSLSNVDPFVYYGITEPTYQTFNDPIYDMLTTRTGHLTSQQRARYDELHIIPWNPKVGEDCSQAPSTTLVNRVCRPVYESRYSHPYEQMTYPELTELPSDDPAALYYQSRKGSHLPIEERIQLVIRAAAISGRPGELLSVGRVFQQRGGGSFTSEEVIRRKHALEIVAAEMGDERADPDKSGLQITEILGETAEQEIAKAEDEALMILNEMNTISTGTVGHPTPRR